MKAPDDVSAMMRLQALGWGAKRIAAELGCSKNTVKHWLRRGDWRPCATPSRSKRLDGLADWLAERFRQHAGNADVVRQDLAAEKGIHVSLRTVERAVAPLRRDLVIAARAEAQRIVAQDPTLAGEPALASAITQLLDAAAENVTFLEKG